MQLNESPLVSIVTPVYNGARYLEDLVQSVLKQDYPFIEHIIIDDGSDDDGATVAVLKRYPHLRWWSRENRGQYVTINEGIAAAEGLIVGVISADDVYVTPGAISSVIGYWRSNPGCAFVYGRALRMDAEGLPYPYQLHDMTGLLHPWFQRYYNFIPHCSLFVCRNVITEERMWFDPTTRYCGDWDWIYRLFRTDRTFGFVDQVLSVYRHHDDQVSHIVGMKERAEEKRRLMRKYGLNPSVKGFVHWGIAVYKIAHAYHVGGVSGLRALAGDWRANRRVSGTRLVTTEDEPNP